MTILAATALGAALWIWLGSRASSRLRSLGLTDSTPTGNGAWRVSGGRSRRRRGDDRLSASAQAPVVADLLGAAITAGAGVQEALEVIIDTVDDPVRSRLSEVRASVELGAPVGTAWAQLLDDDALAPIASAVIRSAQTGSPISVVLDAAAADMRRTHRAGVEVAARSAGVRSVAPLALCFLPAYLLVGVVPVIAGFAASLFG